MLRPIKPHADHRLILSSEAFVSGFVPPDYMIDGLLQRRFIYAMTAPTGGGKTAICLLLSAHTAQGLSIGEHGVEKGRVLYLAGENPDDIRMRWIAMADKMDFDADAIDVHFMAGRRPINKMLKTIEQEVDELGGVDLVIVDTSAAYFDGDDENSNVQMGAHGRMLRQLPRCRAGLACWSHATPSRTPATTTSCRAAAAPSSPRWTATSFAGSTTASLSCTGRESSEGQISRRSASSWRPSRLTGSRTARAGTSQP
jgi:hypothetical protein